MKTFYTVHRVLLGASPDEFSSVGEALADAKRRQAADKDNRYAVMKSHVVTVRPVPAIEVESCTEEVV